MLHFVILKKPKQKMVILTAKEKKKRFTKMLMLLGFLFRFVLFSFVFKLIYPVGSGIK